MTGNELPYKWFAEPLKNIAYTNEVIARALQEETDDTRSFCRDVICADGKKHNLWNCSHKMASDLWKSRNSLHISIRIWCQRKGGKTRVSFLFIKRKKLIKAPAQL